MSGSLTGSHKRLLLDILVMVRWCTLSLKAHRRWTWRGAALTCGSSSQYTLRIYVHSLADKAQKYGPAGPRCPLEFGLLQACDSMASSMSLAAAVAPITASTALEAEVTVVSLAFACSPSCQCHRGHASASESCDGAL